MRWQTVILSLLLALATAASSGSTAGAAELPSTRTEQEARLNALQPQMNDLQRELFRARMSHDAAEIKRVSKEFRKLQLEEQQLLRATGQLPPR
ncbi:MAG: hypothetical protein HY699_17895 [Deltaproteobacteria bacterium]|nr:hypothetical protein [Deltaproteobacteria bacterium]